MASIPRLGRSPGGGHGNSTPVFLPGESHGQRRRAGYNPQGHKELDTTEVTAHRTKVTTVTIFKCTVWASLIAQLVKNLPAMQETPVRFLGQEDPLEKG